MSSEDKERSYGFPQDRTLFSCFRPALVVFLCFSGSLFVRFQSGLFSSTASILSEEDPFYRNALTVRLECGAVEGTLVGGGDKVVEWRGLPFAEPPIGQLRWNPPVAASCWNESVYDASYYRPYCTQQYYWSDEEDGEVAGEEDCLYLNVMAPSDYKSRLTLMPVVVWIHGGSLVCKNSSWPGYRIATETVHQAGVVTVSINYRLNAFGFLSLKALSEESPNNSSGNYGFMDQVEALRWVRRNIVRFGGDPTRVTLMGQSSGGTSILALLAAPSARGLFQGAISMSGSCLWNKMGLQSAYEANAGWLARCRDAGGCAAGDLTCLRGIDAATIVRVCNPYERWPYWNDAPQSDLPSLSSIHTSTVGPVAVVDGFFLPHAPAAAAAAGQAANVPLVIGTMAQETDCCKVFVTGNTTYADLATHVRRRLGTFDTRSSNASLTLPAQVLDLYPPNNGPYDVERIFHTIASDIAETGPCDSFAKDMTRSGSGDDDDDGEEMGTGGRGGGYDAPVWRYVVTGRLDKTCAYNGKRSHFSFHSLDFWAAMSQFEWNDRFDAPPYEPTHDDLKFGASLRNFYLDVIFNGTRADMPTYQDGNVILFAHGGEVQVVGDYHAKQRKIYYDAGVRPYGWRN